VYWARGRLYARIELDLAECAFVVRHVLVENRGQGLCLLRAQINSLKVAHLDLTLRLLLHSSEDEEKVPDVNTHLHTVSIGFAILRGVYNIKIRLRRINHTAHSLAEGREMGDPAKGEWPACAVLAPHERDYLVPGTGLELEAISGRERVSAR